MENKDEIISTPATLGNFLVNDCDDEYEFTDCLHGDIEYLYVINLDSESVTCISVWNFDEKFTDDELIECIFTPDDNNFYVYYASMWDVWCEIERKMKEED